MSADTVVADVERTASGRGRRWWPGKPVPDLVASLLSRDVFGVRLGVLLLILPMVAATMAFQITSRQGWNHPPDSRYYLPMMSRDLGHSWGDAVRIERGISPSWNLSPWYFADNDPSWQMVRTRLLYPVLSIPFIWLWGLSGGSLAIPFLGVILFLWATAHVLQRLYGPAVAVIVAGTFTLVPTVTVFSWAGTDTLAMGLAAVIVANLPIERRIGRANLVWLGAASVFIALTRQVGVLAPAMAGAGWLWCLVRERTWRNRWLSSLIVTAATTVVVQVAAMTLASTDAGGVIGRGETTYWGIFRQFIHSMKLVTQQAMTYMWHDNRILYALLIGAGISVLARFASDASAVFVGGVAATYVISAGVGFSSYMRYEMILFPAAAVAAGGLVWLALGDRLPASPPSGSDPGAEEAEPVPARSRAFSLGIGDKLAGTGPGRFLGLHQPRADRWKPQLILNSAVLAIVIAVSVPGSWRSAAAAPPSPSYAAAQGGHDYAVEPLAKPPAEVALKTAFDMGVVLSHDTGDPETAFDWVHLMRYRPLTPDQPGWTTRDKDGTALIHPNGLDRNTLEAFGMGISLNRTVKSDSVKILSRQVSEYGEDVVFTVQDTSGVVHKGTATTLYPIWDKKGPGVVTALVFDPWSPPAPMPRSMNQ